MRQNYPFRLKVILQDIGLGNSYEHNYKTLSEALDKADEALGKARPGQLVIATIYGPTDAVINSRSAGLDLRV